MRQFLLLLFMTVYFPVTVSAESSKCAEWFIQTFPQSSIPQGLKDCKAEKNKPALEIIEGVAILHAMDEGPAKTQQFCQIFVWSKDQPRECSGIPTEETILRDWYQICEAPALEGAENCKNLLPLPAKPLSAPDDW